MGKRHGVVALGQQQRHEQRPSEPKKHKRQATQEHTTPVDEQSSRSSTDPFQAFLPSLGARMAPAPAPISAENRQPRWMRDRIVITDTLNTDESSNTLKLSAQVESNLRQELGIERLFAMQVVVAREIMRDRLHGGDVAVCAPTGSGKTLAFALPIVEVLSSRLQRRLRALVLVPTRELASQALGVFEALTVGTGLTVAAVAGAQSFKAEQTTLVWSPRFGDDTSSNLEASGFGHGEEDTAKKRGTCSRVDILVATPGRLVDHLDGTPGFTLEHLRFLVVDEADRLLQQSFYDWLPRVLAGCHGQPANTPATSNFSEKETFSPAERAITMRQLRTVRKLNPARKSALDAPLRKLLFSATLTHNPKQLAPLNLVAPVHFVYAPTLVDNHADADPTNDAMMHDSGIPDGGDVIGSIDADKFVMPASLSQYIVECPAADKPLILLHMLHNLRYTGNLCFVSSVESAHRLYLLLAQYPDVPVAEFTGRLKSAEREEIIQRFKRREIALIVCSDVMARGLDLMDDATGAATTGGVQRVINYDAPMQVRQYVHRCGRSARAGRSGEAITLLQPEQARHFKRDVLRRVVFASGHGVQRLHVERSDLAQFRAQYQDALDDLRDTLHDQRLQPR